MSLLYYICILLNLLASQRLCVRKSSYHLILGELQQQLLRSGIAELHRRLHVLSGSLHLQYITDTETLVFYHIARTQTAGRNGG